MPDVELQFAALKRQFIREARQMAKLIHPNIVAVHQVFEENNTAYMALDQVKGVDLTTLSQEHPERITNAFLHTLLDQILKAIGHTHDHGVLHRDISPDNILADDADHITLIDFGAARESGIPSTGNQSIIVAVKDGYSPHEFYVSDARHDFSSDLYSLGATLYDMITGSPPPDCQSRLAAVSSGAPDPYLPLASSDFDFDYNILATVDRALEIPQEDRFQSASDWATELETTPRVRPARRPELLPDPHLETKIAQIVASTNTLLQRRKPDSAPTGIAPPTAQSVAPESQKVVDIFGNRIDDLEAWQAEQELEIQARQMKYKKPDDTRKPEQEETDPKRKSWIMNLISRCLPGRRASRLP
ncbi:protein kinase domain-containing protein [Roseovarius azorensis]|nr:protein kinase [Roseovarius azorensis]